MERTLKCVRFQSKRIFAVTVGFTIIYLLAFFVLITVMSFIPQGTDSSHESTNASYFFSAVIFAFAVISSLYGGTFNNLLMFGNTRKTIVSSFLLNGIGFSALLAIISEFGEQLDGIIAHFLPVVRNSGIEQIYKGINPLSEMLWFFTLFLIVVMIADIYGALCYKIGKIFIIIFWCGLGILAMLTSLFSIKSIFTSFVNGAMSFFGYNVPGGIYWCSLHFFIVAAVLGAVLWLIARRQPQNA